MESFTRYHVYVTLGLWAADLDGFVGKSYVWADALACVLDWLWFGYGSSRDHGSSEAVRPRQFTWSRFC